MKIKTIVVEVRETVSLPGYANVSRGVSLEGKLSKGEGWKRTHARLTEMAEDLVFQEIDDALEANGVPPKHYSGLRYTPVYSVGGNSTAVIPSGYRDLPSGWYEVRDRTGYRRGTAERLALDALPPGGAYLGVLEDGDCLASYEDEPTPEAPQVPIEAEPASGIVCPKCDPNPAPDKIRLLCSEHEEISF